jgi:hypothetical protein
MLWQRLTVWPSWYRAIAIILMANALSGCSHETSKIGTTDRSSPLSVWRSPNTTAQERADGVNKGIPKGTDIEMVKMLLGEDAELVHYHGPSADLVTGSTGTHDYWRLEYKASDGLVALDFRVVSRATGSRFVFDRAYFTKDLGTFPLRRD